MKIYSFFLSPSERKHQFSGKPVFFRIGFFKYAAVFRLYWFKIVLYQKTVKQPL